MIVVASDVPAGVMLPLMVVMAVVPAAPEGRVSAVLDASF